MADPYRVPPGSPPRFPRSVRLPTVLAVLIGLGGLAATLPAAVLLNQRWQIVPIHIYFTGFEYEGEPVFESSVIAASLVVAGLFALMSLILGLFAWRNAAHNRRLREEQLSGAA